LIYERRKVCFESLTDLAVNPKEERFFKNWFKTKFLPEENELFSFWIDSVKIYENTQNLST